MYKMYQTNKLNFLILLPIIFLFIPSMYVGNIPVYDLIIGFTYFCLLLSNRNLFLLNQVVTYKKYTYVKILLFYIGWVFLSGIILILFGKYNILYASYVLLILFLYNNFSWFLYPSLIFPRFFSLRLLIKFILIGIYIVCIYGLLVFIFDKLDLLILKPIHNIIVNRRLLGASMTNSLLLNTRVLSVFEEPGYLGGFLCINLPIIYSTILSKNKILINKSLNYLFKKSYIPLIFITIIMTKSPIWLIFSLLTSLIYFSRTIFKQIKRYFVVIFFSIFVIIISLIISFRYINYNETYLSRIILVVRNVRTMEQFIIIEPSLANRIINYSVRFKVFLKNPIMGVGYRNTEYHVASEFDNMPITKEIQECIYNSKNGFVQMNGAILWNTLSDTGAIGTLLYYMFLFLLIKKCNKLKNALPFSIEYSFLQGLQKSYIAILCFSCYDIRPNYHYFWFLFGLIICFNKYVENRYKGNVKKNEKNMD